MPKRKFNYNAERKKREREEAAQTRKMVTLLTKAEVAIEAVNAAFLDSKTFNRISVDDKARQNAAAARHSMRLVRMQARL